MLRDMTAGRPGWRPCEPASLGATDEALLGLYVALRDEEAFEVLVARHGPAVLRSCRHLLGDGPECEDAFQATFVVLARRAGEIRRPGSLSSWLQGVARRVASRAGERSRRLRLREGTSLDDRDPAAPEDGPDRDLRPAVREAVDLLPEKYRRPIELCYWQGLSSEEAAARLDCPTGTLKWRLMRGRELLRGRLARVMLALIVGLLPRKARAAAVGLVGRAGGPAKARPDAAPDRGLPGGPPGKRVGLALVAAGALLLPWFSRDFRCAVASWASPGWWTASSIAAHEAYKPCH